MTEISEETGALFKFVRERAQIPKTEAHYDYGLSRQGYYLLEDKSRQISWKQLRRAILQGLENGAKPKDLIQAILDDRQKDD